MTELKASERLRASAARGLQGHVVVPGDKSISHRAVILGALAAGETRIEGLLESRDIFDTIAAVRAFGADVDRSYDGTWRVRGCAWRSPDAVVDCGNSGTGARLLIGAAAGFGLEARFTGDSSLRQRPMGRIVEPLQRMGARFDGRDRLPLTLRGGQLDGIRHLDETGSAQVKSAILLAGLGASGPVEVVEPAPSRDHTETMLAAFGCDIETGSDNGRRLIRLGERRRLEGIQIEVPGDPSSAAFPVVAASIVRNSGIIVHGVLINPLRAGLFETLTEMGADLVFTNPRLVGGETVADLVVRSSPLSGVTVPAGRAPSMIDEYPILAIAAACARGDTIMRGVGELRVKESDRLAAIVGGLAACGVEALAEGDSLRVRGRGAPPEGGAAIPTHGDHRIAMSFLTLGLAARRPVAVDQADMIGTSFPGFAALMRSLGGAIAPVA